MLGPGNLTWRSLSPRPLELWPLYSTRHLPRFPPFYFIFFDLKLHLLLFILIVPFVLINLILVFWDRVALCRLEQGPDKREQKWGTNPSHMGTSLTADGALESLRGMVSFPIKAAGHWNSTRPIVNWTSLSTANWHHCLGDLRGEGRAIHGTCPFVWLLSSTVFSWSLFHGQNLLFAWVWASVYFHIKDHTLIVSSVLKF